MVDGERRKPVEAEDFKRMSGSVSVFESISSTLFRTVYCIGRRHSGYVCMLVYIDTHGSSRE